MSERRPINAIPPARWPWAVGAVVAIALMVGIVYAVTSDSAESPPDETPTAVVTASPGETARADGCLGGPDADEAILVVQDQAPLTGNGAASFLATYVRWHGRSALTRKEFEELGPDLWAPSLDSEWTDWDELHGRSEPSLYTDTWTSFKDESYRIEQVTSSTVTVSLSAVTFDGTAQVSRLPLVLRAEIVDDQWRFAGSDMQLLGRVSNDDIRAGGTPFEGGC